MRPTIAQQLIVGVGLTPATGSTKKGVHSGHLFVLRAEDGDNVAIGETYEEFVEKFKPKKTTDDCYTPPSVYAVIRDWACEEYGIDPDKIVRPFFPGGDYEHFDYSDGVVVLDNPPFSILTSICQFYLDRGIHFFFICAKFDLS